MSVRLAMRSRNKRHTKLNPSEWNMPRMVEKQLLYVSAHLGGDSARVLVKGGSRHATELDLCVSCRQFRLFRLCHGPYGG